MGRIWPGVNLGEVLECLDVLCMGGKKSLTSLSSPLENNGDSTSKLIIRKVT